MTDLNNKTILITGGAGAIGSNLAKRLLAEYSCKIIVVDDLSSGHTELLPDDKKLEFHQTSVINDDMLEKIFSQKIDVVFHLAALFANQKSVDQPREDLMVNGMGTLKLLQACAKGKVEKFVYSSSSCVYGNKNRVLEEKDTDFSLDTPYAITKLLGEKYCTYYHEHYSLPTVTLRYFNAYGPGEYPGKYRNVIPNFFKLAINRQPLTVMGTGNETRDFTFYYDNIQGTIKAAEKDKAAGEIFNIGSGAETRVIDIAEKINKLCENEGNIKFIPARDWDSVKKRVASIEKAKKILSYRPEYGIEKGLDITFNWFKEMKIK